MRKKAAPKIAWNPGLRKLPALSVRQPWAWLIVNGYKDVENRSRRIHHRGPILIHASRNTSLLNGAARNRIQRRYSIKLPDTYELGGIVGIADDLLPENPSGL